MADTPFYKFFLRYADRDHLVDVLYRRCMDDIIMRSNHPRDEIYSLAQIAFDEIEKLCCEAYGPAKKDEGTLETYQNNDLLEVVCEKNGQRYDMMMIPWKDWMNMPVYCFKNPEEFVEAAFITLTFFGFTSADCEKRCKEIEADLQRAEEDIEAGRYIEAEALDKEIDEILSRLSPNEKEPNT